MCVSMACASENGDGNGKLPSSTTEVGSFELMSLRVLLEYHLLLFSPVLLEFMKGKYLVKPRSALGAISSVVVRMPPFCIDPAELSVRRLTPGTISVTGRVRIVSRSIGK